MFTIFSCLSPLSHMRHVPCPFGSIWIVQLMSTHWPVVCYYVCMCALLLQEQSWPCDIHTERFEWQRGPTMICRWSSFKWSIVWYVVLLLFTQYVTIVCNFAAMDIFKVFFCRRKTYLKCIIKLDDNFRLCGAFCVTKTHAQMSIVRFRVWILK